MSHGNFLKCLNENIATVSRSYQSGLAELNIHKKR